jgi:hypothetical protein
MAEPRFLHEYKDIYEGFLDRARSLVVDGYWHLKTSRTKHKMKGEDFVHIQNATEGVVDALAILIDAAEGERDKPGVQPMINEVLSVINIHLDRIEKYYPDNEPKNYKTKESQREEGKFQQLVFKGEWKIRAEIKKLNIDNNMDGFEIGFFKDEIATLPMKSVLCKLLPEVAAKVESLDIDWDLVMDNGMYINMSKRDVPDYNSKKHFWDQEPETLQFYVSEWNKILNGITIDGYYIHGWLYDHLNYFKTPIGDIDDDILNPPLRDNEWYMHEILKDAEARAKKLEDAGVFVFGTRRFAKSTFEASFVYYKLKTNPAKNGTLTATNSEDIESITDKINIALEYCHPAFYIGTNTKDFSKIVKFGLKTKSGRELKLFYLNIINTDSGSKRGGQKTAGGAPVVFVMDEAGKEDFLKSYNAAIPSFETSKGWKCIPFFVGTGGETDLSAEAEKVLANPKSYRFIEMDWDLLERTIPKEAITWIRRKFGWFIPAQMGYKKGFKRIERTFADFLDIKSEELSKITILQTDWVNNTRVCREERAKLKTDKTQLQQEIVFYPLDPEECFMSAKKNPYPASGIKRHKEKLQAEGDRVFGTGRKVILERNKENPHRVDAVLDGSKEVSEYPHDGSFSDCPFILYDDFPEIRPTDSYRFVAGLDDYKQDESEGDSIGAFYIFDRLKRKIVLGLANRPDPHTDFHKQMHMALDAFNAKCFMENEDMDFKKYLDRVAEPSMYLYTGFDAYDDFSKFQNGKRKFGWRPDKNTVPIVRGYSVDYTKDDIDYIDDKDNITHTVSGFERIEDIQLMEEMIKFKPGGNFDRLVAFGSCLAIDYYLTCNYLTPQSHSTKAIDENPALPTARSKFFTKKRRSSFSR